MKTVEDYCWAITRAIERSCSDQSSFWVLGFDLSWIPLYIHTRELLLAETSMRLSFFFAVRSGGEKSAVNWLLTLLLDLPFAGKYSYSISSVSFVCDSTNSSVKTSFVERSSCSIKLVSKQATQKYHFHLSCTVLVSCIKIIELASWRLTLNVFQVAQVIAVVLAVQHLSSS